MYFEVKKEVNYAMYMYKAYAKWDTIPSRDEKYIYHSKEEMDLCWPYMPTLQKSHTSKQRIIGRLSWLGWLGLVLSF